jgi:signal transduction histidine kinase
VRALLRSVWDEPRPAAVPVGLRRDRVLVAAIVGCALVEGAVRPDIPLRPLWIGVTVALAPALLWRRTHPLLALGVVFGTVTVVPLLTGSPSPDVHTLAFALLLILALFRWGSGREAVLGGLVVLAKLGQGLLGGELRSAGDLGGALAIVTAVSGVGVALRYRASARDRRLEQVAMLERERLARDLHDTVAHHVSALVIRAQAGLATAGTDPAAATEALKVIEAEATRTLAEMRAMVRVLRDDRPPELAPGPGLRDVARLAGPEPPGHTGHTGHAGPTVVVELTGDVDDVPSAVGAAVYRLAQESVTNARRHARHATRIDVHVDADDAQVRLRVTDDGDGGHGRSAGPGYGLLGMAERAQLLGGTCEAGPGPGRGWTVTAALPRVRPA